MRDPDDVPRRLKIRAGAQSAVLWAAEKYGVQTERLRKTPHIGRAMAAYSRYYRIDLRDAASAVVYYATLSLLPVLVLGYLALAWLAQRRPNLLKNADQNLADTLGIPVSDVSSLFDAQAHALLTAMTSLVGVIGVLYGGWAWMNTLSRALRAVWLTDDAPEPWKRFTRDSLAALAGIPLMFVAFSVAGIGVTHLLIRYHRSGLLTWRTVESAGTALGFLLISAALFAVICQQLCRRLGGAQSGRDLWLASAASGVGLAVLAAAARVLVQQTVANPYGIVLSILGLMIWVSIAIRIVLSLAVWVAEDDPVKIAAGATAPAPPAPR